MKSEKSLLDQFLKQVINQRQPTAIYLLNGIKLAGQVIEFGEDVIVLHPDQKVKPLAQIIYRHAIATIMASIEVHTG